MSGRYCSQLVYSEKAFRSSIHGTKKEKNGLQFLLLLIGRVDRIHKSFLSGFPLLLMVSFFSVFTLWGKRLYNAEVCFSLTHTHICSRLRVAYIMDLFQ